MREPLSLGELFMMYRHEFGYSFVACVVACARHWQQANPFREIVTNGLICGMAAFGISSVLEYFGIDGNQWSYLASVTLGYVGVEATLDGIAGRLPFLKRRSGSDV